jgi:hypothetical protein
VAGYELDLKIDKGFGEEAKALFYFLRQAGRRHPVVFSVRRVSDGEYHATITAEPETRIDAFLQKLMMSRALYYYACGIKNRRTESPTCVYNPFVGSGVGKALSLARPFTSCSSSVSLCE